MKKALLIASVLVVAVISTACINNIAVQELNNKAAEYMQKGDYESAMNRLQASLDLDSSMYQTYYNLGVAAINANKFDKAIDALESGIKIKPDYADFYYSLGVAQIGLADEILEKANVEDKAAESPEAKMSDVMRDISDEERMNVKTLKKSAMDSLNKYLDMEPNTTDRESVIEMIKQCEEYIVEEDKKEV